MISEGHVTLKTGDNDAENTEIKLQFNTYSIENSSFIIFHIFTVFDQINAALMSKETLSETKES